MNDAPNVLPLKYSRVMGQETEYMVLPERLQPMMNDNILMSAMPAGFVAINGFLNEGGRLYMDTNHHPEYAGQECLTGKGVARSGAKGDALVSDIFTTLRATEHNDVQPFGDIRLFKRTRDVQGNSRANHENYFTSHRHNPEELAARLTPHLISRIIFTGPGIVDGDGSFAIDQRAWNMSDKYFGTGSTAEARPFVLNRNEHHGSTGRRLQVISGSINMFSSATEFMFDSTSIALRLIEHNLLPDWLLLRDNNPGGTMRHFAGQKFGDNLRFTRNASFTGGRQLTAPQIQTTIAEIAVEQAEKGNLNDYDAAFAEKWRQLAEDAMEGKIELHTKSIEWLAKLALIEEYRAKHPNISNDKLCEIDLMWHELPTASAPDSSAKTPETIMELLRRKRGLDPNRPSKEHIAHIRHEPHEPTRAVLRAHAVNVLAKTASAYLLPHVDWAEWGVEVSHEDQNLVLRSKFPNPYDSIKASA